MQDVTVARMDSHGLGRQTRFGCGVSKVGCIAIAEAFGDPYQTLRATR